MARSKVPQVGPAVVDDTILRFHPVNIMLLEERGDVLATGKAHLGVIWPKLLKAGVHA